MTKRSIGILALFVAISTFACSSGTTPPPPACDSTCEDSVAVRALRETFGATLHPDSVRPLK